jgi:hypothetical protein
MAVRTALDTVCVCNSDLKIAVTVCNESSISDYQTKPRPMVIQSRDSIYLLASHIVKNEIRLVPSACCASVSPHKLLNAGTNIYITWYVHHYFRDHLNGVLHKSLPSVCVSTCERC